ncbi:acyl-CoA dehydrogenase [Kineosporia sp. NBRC 101677]|uniref:acyl-CoA dehydrogenase family protein n=1 Tax=Kineosporia sp. NBRC 101677 TaxID=3032197 RepID=UPI0024A2DB78|nr:acyl-CoA dehydrogenase family protein [Kineosporia sp. NBRC 101677]GLY15234.1 acyl-CoA dehydrogenase [Kineosporia sp. NBRC 101677]
MALTRPGPRPDHLEPSDGPDDLDDLARQVEDWVAGQAGQWDLDGRLPVALLRRMSAAGALCTQVPRQYGGRGATSSANGEFTARVGAQCSSLRSVLTSQGMAAWVIERLGSEDQRGEWLPRLSGGALAAVAFSEAQAGSDLSAISTTIRTDGHEVVIEGDKLWTTAATYADMIVVIGRHQDGAAAVVVPADAPGVSLRPVPAPSGCRAAGHADVSLRGVRLPASAVLGGGDQALPMLITTALASGRLSVAWGCVGILRACLASASAHAATREQFGRTLGQHQLVAGHLADLLVAERSATWACQEASRRWDDRSPDLVIATVLAKQVAATRATHGSALAAQVLGSAGAQDGHVVSRAHRDARLMELIEGTTEICRTLLAGHVLTGVSR